MKHLNVIKSSQEAQKSTAKFYDAFLQWSVTWLVVPAFQVLLFWADNFNSANYPNPAPLTIWSRNSNLFLPTLFFPLIFPSISIINNPEWCTYKNVLSINVFLSWSKLKLIFFFQQLTVCIKHENIITFSVLLLLPVDSNIFFIAHTLLWTKKKECWSLLVRCGWGHYASKIYLSNMWVYRHRSFTKQSLNSKLVYVKNWKIHGAIQINVSLHYLLKTN